MPADGQALGVQLRDPPHVRNPGELRKHFDYVFPPAFQHRVLQVSPVQVDCHPIDAILAKRPADRKRNAFDDGIAARSVYRAQRKLARIRRGQTAGYARKNQQRQADFRVPIDSQANRLAR